MTYSAKPGRRSVVCVDVRPSKGTVIRWDLAEADALEVVADLHRLAADARELVGVQSVRMLIPAGGGWFIDHISPETAIALADSITDVLEARDAVA